MVEKKFTRDELAKYNGDGEKPHYMAVDGTVYDITDAPKKGIDEKTIMQVVFGYAKDKDAVLKKLPVVGKLAD
ncbi:cytochrome B5 [Limosilactobacillus sp. STM2_1]|uniref:Cytochrome B5 n=1 Tax=Limosilactobacillus rudii TaxID=2759755 RepID=A0A7W3UKS5_9LACO|nr:cytochrome b5 domain-containing protein [Limosilactobacillus rudii]MBB1079254.1 cytochrome B5 [Limosilactobacillus rudii]MBB1097343.1 cytochrome B5 [Limosilactobacillus rudii]MCD7134452.1 cytochrome B5 [Limosilactobacillus rudii]